MVLHRRRRFAIRSCHTVPVNSRAEGRRVRPVQLAEVLAAMPEPAAQPAAGRRAARERRQEGLSIRPTLPDEPPPLRMLLVLDNLAGHKTPEFVCWLFEHGIMPLYTPVGGSWLNMAESMQRIPKRRALAGQHPEDVGQIIAWFEAVARHWNAAPTPFVWGGKRAARRQRQRERRHRVGGSGACTRVPLRRAARPTYGDEQAK